MELPKSYKDIPEPRGWLSMAGPGAIMVATSLGSGEIYFWPNLSVGVGSWVLVIAFMAIGMQYVLNTEISRYTITTGETIIYGFNRLWKPLPWVLLLCCTLPWAWPGWAMGGATALSWILGGDPLWYGVISLLLTGVLLSLGRTLYKTLELTQLVLIAVTILACLALFVFFGAISVVPSIVTSYSSEGWVKLSKMEVSVLLTALAFCGAGGTINLAQSHYIREKGFGMTSHMPPLLNPVPLGGLLRRLFGKPAAQDQGVQDASHDAPAIRGEGFLFEPSQENERRWTVWWKEVRREQFVNFFLIGVAGLFLLSLMAVKLVGDQIPESGMALLVQELEAVEAGWPSMRVGFALVVTLVFFTSEVGVLDHVCRLVADISGIKGFIVPGRPWRSEGAVYLYTLWLMIASGTFILLALDIQQPPQLLVIAGSFSGVAMFIYTMALLVLIAQAKKGWKSVVLDNFAQSNFNPFHVPRWRLLVLCTGCLVFGLFSAFALMDIVKRF